MKGQQPQPGPVRAFWRALAPLVVLVLFLAPSLAAQEPAPDLVIFYTNDVHGYATEQKDDQGRLTHIGYPRLKSFVKSFPVRNKLLLDAGDVLSGQPLATVSQGEFIARVLEKMNYDALAPGNHDFDYGLARLMALKDRFQLAFLGANIIEREDGGSLLPPYIVKDFGVFKVGVFALAHPGTPRLTSPGNVESLIFASPDATIEIARQMVTRLRDDEGARMVVALTHLGTDPQEQPGARALARGAPGLDLIIDGHSHSPLAGLREGDTLIVSSGARLENLGLVAVRTGPGGRLSLASRLMGAAEFGAVAPEAGLQALLASLSAEADEQLNQVLARLPFALDGEREHLRRGSTNLGRVVCAALKKASGADAAIINSGSFRDSLPAGEITRRRLLSALPADNYAVTVTLSGAELLEVLNHGLGQPGSGAFPQFYGLTVTAQESLETGPDGSLIRRDRAELVEVGGRPLDPEAGYRIVTTDFLQKGGDDYRLLARPADQVYGPVEEIMAGYLADIDEESLIFIDRDDALTIIVEE